MSAFLSNTKSVNSLTNSRNFPLMEINDRNQNDLERHKLTKEYRSSIPLFNLDDNRIATKLLSAKNTGNFVSDLSKFNLTVATNNQFANPSLLQPLANSNSGFIEDPPHIKLADTNSAIAQTEQNQFFSSDLENLGLAEINHSSDAQPIQNFSNTVSQGNVAINADVAQEESGLTGENVTIGVLSDSFNSLGGASSDIASGELPSDVKVLSDLPRGGRDEGRAMSQIIHDLAPEADLVFHTAAGGKVNFAQGILELAEAGADIIVDDVAYFNEPFFQESIIARAINQVTEQGVTYFSAAGNSGRQSYESEFRPSGLIFDFGNFQLEAHDFKAGAGIDPFQEITVPKGEQVTFSFQWNEPFPRLSNGNGAKNNIDIFLLNEEKTRVIEGSFEANQGKNPLEIFRFTNDGSFDGNTFNLAIGRTLNSESPDLMKYIGFGGLSIEEFDTDSSTIFGHANAEEAITVGAASFTDTPAFGTNPPQVEEFSSAGGTSIQFDNQGNRLEEPEIPQKPDIVAPDGTNTTFFGNDIAADADSDPNFFGTSAAAPHAAGAAALLKDADPNLTPDQIENLLETTAIDMDDPGTPGFDTGFDPVTGEGLIQADEALTALETNQETIAASEPVNLGMYGSGNKLAGDFMGQEATQNHLESFLPSTDIV